MPLELPQLEGHIGGGKEDAMTKKDETMRRSITSVAAAAASVGLTAAAVAADNKSPSETVPAGAVGCRHRRTLLIGHEPGGVAAERYRQPLGQQVGQLAAAVPLGGWQEEL